MPKKKNVNQYLKQKYFKFQQYSNIQATDSVDSGYTAIPENSIK